jgi:hypothetical protein
MYRAERLELRLSAADLSALDYARGPTSRSAYLRHLIHQAAQQVRSVTEQGDADAEGPLL